MKSIVAAAVVALAFQDQKSALESDASGWIDLMPSKDLKGWKRVKVKDPVDREVWKVSEDGKTLSGDGVGTIEMLLYEKEFGDGIWHVEWRWRKAEGEKPVYNGGVYVRTALDGKAWVQAQVARADKSPVVGDLMATLPGETKRSDFFQKGPSPEKPMGEWNTYEVTCKGKTVSLWVNGAVTATWDACPMAKGHVGMQAEFAFIEWRNLRFKPLP